MNRLALVPVAAMCLALPGRASAFCGFYVAGADSELYNNATMVVMMREGTRTVLSMQNNYQGPPEDFAMVVPVPTVLSEDNVKILKRSLFDRVDSLAAPRLVEYWERDPCFRPEPRREDMMDRAGAARTPSAAGESGDGGMEEIVVEAEFAVGEYEIVILGAKDALALETWLGKNGYRIPDGAAEYLRPYVERGEKFFVAKVDVSKVTYKDGMATLSPLRVHYDTETFALPIRLGLINAGDTQDLIVHILGRNQRYEVANYKNVAIPTNLAVADQVRDRFGEFYAALLDATLEKNPGAVVTEYSWDSSTCDPCPGSPLNQAELMSLGLDVLHDQQKPRSALRFMRPVMTGVLDKYILMRILRRTRRRFMACHDRALTADPKLAQSSANVELSFIINAIGRIEKVRVGDVPPGPASAAMKKCFADTIESVRFPSGKGGGLTRVEIDLALRTGIPTPRASGMVLTRLHARYDRDNLGDDLVFKQAPAIAGGQGGATPPSKEARPAGRNTFQGRYIIRHEWTGPIECDDPIRGRWGGPPADVDGSRGPTVARDLAFAPRGRIELEQMVREPVTALSITPPPRAVVDTATSRSNNAQGKKSATAPGDKRPPKRSLGCAAGGGDPGLLGLVLALAVLIGRQRAPAARAG